MQRNMVQVFISISCIHPCLNGYFVTIFAPLPGYITLLHLLLLLLCNIYLVTVTLLHLSLGKKWFVSVTFGKKAKCDFFLVDKKKKKKTTHTMRYTGLLFFLSFWSTLFGCFTTKVLMFFWQYKKKRADSKVPCSKSDFTKLCMPISQTNFFSFALLHSLYTFTLLHLLWYIHFATFTTFTLLHLPDYIHFATFT